MSNQGAHVIGIYGNIVCVKFFSSVKMNEVAYIELSENNNVKVCLKAEVIRVLNDVCDLQVFEDSRKIKVGDKVLFTRKLLSIDLGPGLLNNIYDGLGNPLLLLSKKTGYFFKRGFYLDTIEKDKEWMFVPIAKIKNIIIAGETLGIVKENFIIHRIMVPFYILGEVKVINIVKRGIYKLKSIVATIKSLDTGKIYLIDMIQKWPVKKPIKAYAVRLLPKKPLTTKVRIVDTFFPIAEGGTACIPGPFGSGKTIFQQSVSKFGDADIVIIAACGERAGEVIEILKNFPKIIDSKTERSLMERTIIICNTSSMPVSARETSIYTAVTMAEYYRQMSLQVLLLVDSTSRWAQALREISGRLEEIPGEEGFPAYLGSLLASFYERAGVVLLGDKNLGFSSGSVTIIGTVSPAGGNFEEPVTQVTLSLVGCFLGLTYTRSYAKKYPAISPLDSWSKYFENINKYLNILYYKEWVLDVNFLMKLYINGQKINDQIRVIGEEEVTLVDFIYFLKSEFFDAVFLQQNAFDLFDSNPSIQRTSLLLKEVKKVMITEFNFSDKNDARNIILCFTSLFRELNITLINSIEYNKIIKSIRNLLFKRKKIIV